MESNGKFTPVSYTHLDVYKRQGEMATSPKGRMAATVLLPLETSMPTEFMHLPPIQICNRNPSFSRCRFNLLGDTNSMAQPA